MVDKYIFYLFLLVNYHYINSTWVNWLLMFSSATVLENRGEKSPFTWNRLDACEIIIVTVLSIIRVQEGDSWTLITCYKHNLYPLLKLFWNFNHFGWLYFWKFRLNIISYLQLIFCFNKNSFYFLKYLCC